MPPGRRRRRAEAVRRTRRRPARRQRRSQRRGRRAKRSCCPARLGATVDRTDGRSGSLGYLDYSHPVFEVFKAPRSGDFSAAHVFRYRALADRRRPIASSRGSTTARWRRRSEAIGARPRRSSGRRRSTIRGPTSRVKPVFLPLVHQLVRYLAHYEQPTSWLTVGQVLDLDRARSRTRRSATASSSRRRASASRSRAPAKATRAARAERAGHLRDPRRPAPPRGRPEAIAVNIDPAESDLSADRPARARGRGDRPRDTDRGAAGGSRQEMTPRGVRAAPEPLVVPAVAGLLLLAAETVIANRLSRKEKFL